MRFNILNYTLYKHTDAHTHLAKKGREDEVKKKMVRRRCE